MAAARTRSGATLVIVSGLSAMLLGIATAFLVRLRGDGDEVKVVMREAQARMMLYAACNFIQESSRLGHGSEAFGWLDPRGASVASDVGPRDAAGSSLAAVPGAWPAQGGTIRCPMYVMERPPFAVQLTYAYNPVTADPTTGDRTDPQTGASLGETGDWRRYARFTVPDPLPALPANLAYPNYLNPALTPAAKSAWTAGDTKPRPRSLGMSWFRVYRETDAERDGDGTPYYDTVNVTGMPTTFIVTCGAGATLGFASWAEVQAAGQDGQFADQAFFEELRARETLLWFRVEWSASVNGGTFAMYRRDTVGDFLGKRERYQYLIPNIQGPNSIPLITPATATSTGEAIFLNNGAGTPSGTTQRTFNYARKSQLNFCGTIRWIQRLDRAPPNW